jgi:glycosyl transferase family 25
MLIIRDFYKVVISIDQDRLLSFKRRNSCFDEFVVHGVNGKKLDSLSFFNYIKGSAYTVLSPSEVGCSLSHIKAYEDFLSRQQEFLLVLEDDVTFRDIDFNFDKINLPNDFIDSSILIHLGGQDGLPSRNKLFGRILGSSINSRPIWEVSPFSYRWLWRTSGYIVNRKMAMGILLYQKSNLKVADSWRYWIKRLSPEVYYVDLIEHPADLLNSSIQIERDQKDEVRFLINVKNKLSALFLYCVNMIFFKRIKSDA